MVSHRDRLFQFVYCIFITCAQFKMQNVVPQILLFQRSLGPRVAAPTGGIEQNCSLMTILLYSFTSASRNHQSSILRSVFFSSGGGEDPRTLPPVRTFSLSLTTPLPYSSTVHVHVEQGIKMNNERNEFFSASYAS